MSSGRMERAGKSLAKLKLTDSISQDDLARAAWPAAVGKRIAVHAAAKSLVRGSLIVEVEDSIWQKQLFYLRFQILAKLQEVVGAGLITDVEFRIATPRRPPQPALSLNDAKPADEADAITDPGMRTVYKQARKKASA
jgi:predicted nucleic acid-binding Zn ribbon protein